jgi:hypothetical protein
MAQWSQDHRHSMRIRQREVAFRAGRQPLSAKEHGPVAIDRQCHVRIQRERPRAVLAIEQTGIAAVHSRREGTVVKTRREDDPEIDHAFQALNPAKQLVLRPQLPGLGGL